MIKACIFDLSGTIVDRYSITSLLSFKKLFSERRLPINNNIILKDMGMNKLDHILSIMNNKFIANQWLQRYDDYPDDIDIRLLVNKLNTIQCEYSDRLIDILPETRSCIDFLNFNYIKTGCTTEYDQKNMNIIKDKLGRNNIYLDSFVSSTCLNKPSRPYPYMIQKNMINLKLDNPEQIIKIDNTVMGIKEGKLAGCITVGVARWSSNMNIININDAYECNINELSDQLKYSRDILKEADYVIDTLDELPLIIDRINYT
jgi:phosphonoacetaldehyde hydrolase